jgi:catechol 2,3-dioxygenase-like lactoylglutathione lyase family enzyme
LADAQERVAHKERFADWQALRAGDSATMPEIQTHPQPVLTSVAAHLYVRDVQASAEFFTGKLGFAVDFLYGEPPFYGELSRDNAKLALRLVEEPVFLEQIRTREALLSATITLASAEEIKQLFLDYQAAKATFQQLLRNEPWQAKTFVVKDPDGNLILFAGPAH